MKQTSVGANVGIVHVGVRMAEAEVRELEAVARELGRTRSEVLRLSVRLGLPAVRAMGPKQADIAGVQPAGVPA